MRFCGYFTHLAARRSANRSARKSTKTAIQPRKRVKEQDALNVMAAYYRENKEALPESVRQLREPIVELIMEGIAPAEAFAQALSAE